MSSVLCPRDKTPLEVFNEGRASKMEKNSILVCPQCRIQWGYLQQLYLVAKPIEERQEQEREKRKETRRLKIVAAVPILKLVPNAREDYCKRKTTNGSDCQNRHLPGQDVCGKHLMSQRKGKTSDG